RHPPASVGLCPASPFSLCSFFAADPVFLHADTPPEPPLPARESHQQVFRPVANRSAVAPDAPVLPDSVRSAQGFVPPPAAACGSAQNAGWHSPLSSTAGPA